MRTAFDYLSCKELPDSEFTVAFIVSLHKGFFEDVFLHIDLCKVTILSIDLRKEHLPNEESLLDTAKRKMAEINKKFNRSFDLHKDR